MSYALGLGRGPAAPGRRPRPERVHPDRRGLHARSRTSIAADRNRARHLRPRDRRRMGPAGEGEARSGGRRCPLPRVSAPAHDRPRVSRRAAALGSAGRQRRIARARSQSRTVVRNPGAKRSARGVSSSSPCVVGTRLWFAPGRTTHGEVPSGLLRDRSQALDADARGDVHVETAEDPAARESAATGWRAPGRIRSGRGAGPRRRSAPASCSVAASAAGQLLVDAVLARRLER